MTISILLSCVCVGDDYDDGFNDFPYDDFDDDYYDDWLDKNKTTISVLLTWVVSVLVMIFGGLKIAMLKMLFIILHSD